METNAGAAGEEGNVLILLGAEDEGETGLGSGRMVVLRGCVVVTPAAVVIHPALKA